ncbi:vacuolar protein sorting-associated protein 13B [Caerostris extrusa]|uniref:Vacuolar protein sorting-associated protein 13B n=1 Tax=Caerostris extrusa TaxID=172846 RepID=A0AAV4NA15_CAEEX|nr:vacuolar protein sorting-associated protein 13B [Caerostris extrusa]
MPDVPDYRACYSELNPMDMSFKQKKPSGYSQCKKTSDSEAKLQNLEENKPSQKLTLWAQLTLSKLCIIILGRLSSSCNYDDFKIQFDTEEIVSSIDIQEIYSKMKIKLSSLNINCFVKKSESHSWEPGPYEGKVIFCSNMISKNKSKMATNSSNLGHSLMKPDNQSFLVATYTKALHSNVKEKLSSAVKQKTLKVKNKEVEVLLLQLDYVTLTSQVENPLPRIILNSDIYANALNSKTITLPGAAVEDRQYQMDICGLMLGSISGPNIICQSDLKKDFVSHYPLTMGENPALEWNIGAIPENRNLAKDSVMIIPIVSPLNIRIVIAPAIVYQSINKDTESEKILVAGISSEVSITSEVCLYLKSPAPTRTCRNYKSLDSTPSSPIISPDSSNFQMKRNSEDISDKYNFMPFELLITAGTISVMLFYYDDCHKSVDDNILSQKFEDFGVPKCSTLNFDAGHPNSVCSMAIDYKKTAISSLISLNPFLCITITQPHSYLLCHPSSQKFEASCFDLQLNWSSADHVIERPFNSCTPMNDDFIYALLETKPGEPHPKTGIPPAFLTVTCSDIFSNQVCVKISVERPMKLNFRTSMGKAIITFLQCFQEKFTKIHSFMDYKFSSSSEKDVSGMMNV